MVDVNVKPRRLWVPKLENLRTEAVDAVIKYLGPMRFTANSPSLAENPAVILRDSMLFRAQSVGYHVDLLQLHFARFSQQSGEKFLTRDKDPSFLMNCRDVLTFLSDDVLFNTTSMLDYIGNLVGFTLGGPNDQRRKWNGVIKAAQDKNNPMGKKVAPQTMLRLHQEWIDRLHGIRSLIIHERVMLGDGGQTITIRDNGLQSTLSFQLPVTVTRRLTFLQSYGDKSANVDVLVGTEQIALRAIDAATSVMTALLADFGGRLVPPKSPTT